MVGHDVDLLPAGIEQLADARDDPVDLLVEVVDEPDADVVSSMVDLAGLGPRLSRMGRRSRSGRGPARRSRP